LFRSHTRPQSKQFFHISQVCSCIPPMNQYRTPAEPSVRHAAAGKPLLTPLQPEAIMVIAAELELKAPVSGNGRSPRNKGNDMSKTRGDTTAEPVKPSTREVDPG